MRYFDLHCDTISECYDQDVPLAQNSLRVSLKNSEVFKPWAQVFAIWIADSLRGEDAVARFEQVYQRFCTEMSRNHNSIRFCRSGKEMDAAFSNAQNAAFLSIEGGAALGGELEKLADFYSKGVRLLTLTWNGECELGDGCMKPDAGGLTSFGRETVREMAHMNMIIDVSHLSSEGFSDVAQETDAPFIASHSNSAAVCPNRRNLEDWQIREIIRRQGLIGLNLHPPFMKESGNLLTLQDLIPHVEHILSLGGEDVLAIGADFDGADVPADVNGISDVASLNGLLEKSFPGKADKILFKNSYRFFSLLT